MTAPLNDNDGFAIDREVEGLSPLARAAYAMIVALTYDTQEEEVSLARVLRGTGITAEQWPAVFDELNDRSMVWVGARDWSANQKALTSEWLGSNAFARLTRAIGAAGRATGREWAELREAAFEIHGRECLYCGSTDDVAVDHVLSIRRGGSNHTTNLVPSCKGCNSAKGAKPWAEWWPMAQARRRGDR